MYLQYCDLGWHVMDEVRIMMTEGCRSGLWGFIPSSFTVCKETFASCHKRLRPWFYGVHTQWGMSSHSCCLDDTATGRGLISGFFFFCPPFALKVLVVGWQVRNTQLWNLICFLSKASAKDLHRIFCNVVICGIFVTNWGKMNTIVMFCVCTQHVDDQNDRNFCLFFGPVFNDVFT